MPIKNRLQADSLVISGGRILLNGEEVGTLDVSARMGVKKKDVLKLWDDETTVAKIFSRVPDDYRFNYYFLNGIEIRRKYRDQGLGSRTMQQWFSSLKAPACVGLEIASSGRGSGDDVVPLELRRFYKRLNFKIFKISDGRSTVPYALTFVKAN